MNSHLTGRPVANSWQVLLVSVLQTWLQLNSSLGRPSLPCSVRAKFVLYAPIKTVLDTMACVDPVEP